MYNLSLRERSEDYGGEVQIDGSAVVRNVTRAQQEERETTWKMMRERDGEGAEEGKRQSGDLARLAARGGRKGV